MYLNRIHERIFFKKKLDFAKLVFQLATVVIVIFTHLEVSLCRERLQTHRATERFVSRVRPHVDLKRRGRREVFVTHVTQVFW